MDFVVRGFKLMTSKNYIGKSIFVYGHISRVKFFIEDIYERCFKHLDRLTRKPRDEVRKIIPKDGIST